MSHFLTIYRLCVGSHYILWLRIDFQGQTQHAIQFFNRITYLRFSSSSIFLKFSKLPSLGIGHLTFRSCDDFFLFSSLNVFLFLLLYLDYYFHSHFTIVFFDIGYLLSWTFVFILCIFYDYVIILVSILIIIA